MEISQFTVEPICTLFGHLINKYGIHTVQCNGQGDQTCLQYMYLNKHLTHFPMYMYLRCRFYPY